MDTFYHQRRQHREQIIDQNYAYDEDNDPDYLLALKLSAELNSAGAPSAFDQQYNGNESINDVLAVYNQGNQDHSKSQAKRKSSAFLLTPSESSTSTNLSVSGMHNDKARVVDYAPEIAFEHVALNTFAEFIHHLKTSLCRLCEKPRFSLELDILNPFQNWMDGVEDQLSCIMKCKNCGTPSCIACIPGTFSEASRIGIRNNEQTISWCCGSGRLFLTWALLCGFDRHFAESRKVEKTAKPAKPNPSAISLGHGKGHKKPVYGSGIGYGGSRAYPQSHLPKGTGYDSYGSNGIVHEEYDSFFEEFDDILKANDPLKASGHNLGYRKPTNTANKEDSMPRARRAQIDEDKFGKLIMAFLTNLLPSLEREALFDYDPPAAILEMLSGSRILSYCAELLRNDSITDIIKRRDLYQTLFSFLTTLGSHSSTGGALFGVRSIYLDTLDLLTLSFCDTVPEEKQVAPSLADCLRNITVQSSLVLQNAANNEADFATDDGQTMLRICLQVSDLAQFIQANNPPHANGKDKITDLTIPEDLPFKSVEENHILPTHKYASNAKKLENSQPGRFKRLITEITTLQTGLPPGIFVRYCENRPDILKCVIIGPVGTPYENGIFEFDFFCGENFPNDPPVVSFKGTGGGTVSINPNLYADGKVCLSLLGTWTGESWKPKESTLLQVLISIQAMILCEEPWYNEPGREADYCPLAAGSPSERYNRRIRMDTVRYALVQWLEKTPELWEDVVAYHFTQHGNEILKQVEEWANEAAKQPQQPKRRRTGTFGGYWDYDENTVHPLNWDMTATANTDIGSMMLRLQTALQKYGATYKVKYVPPPPEPPSLPRSRSESLPSSSAYSPLFLSWAPPSYPIPPLPAFPAIPPGPGNSQPLYPPPYTQDVGRGTVDSGSSGLVPGLQFSSPPPIPVVASSSGPPSSNTRSAARGRGVGGDTNTHSGRGGPSQDLPLPTFGYGRGGASPGPPAPGNPGHLFTNLMSGVWGRGRGRGDNGNRRGH